MNDNTINVSLKQFKSGRNLPRGLAKAKEAVEQMQKSMADLVAKDGHEDDLDPAKGRVRVETSDRSESHTGPKTDIAKP